MAWLTDCDPGELMQTGGKIRGQVAPCSAVMPISFQSTTKFST